MESQPQNPEFRNNTENFHPCCCSAYFFIIFEGVFSCCVVYTKERFHGVRTRKLYKQKISGPVKVHMIS